MRFLRSRDLTGQQPLCTRLKIDLNHIGQGEQTFDHDSALFEIHLQSDESLFRTNIVVTVLVVNLKALLSLRCVIRYVVLIRFTWFLLRN